MGVRGVVAAAALVLGLGGAGAARAQDDKQGDLNVFVKGGLGGYTGELGEFTGTGPSWGVAVNLQPLKSFGFELGYEGATNSITDPRVEAADPSLTRHGVQGLIKLSPPLIERLKPFVAAGVGASRVAVHGETGGLFQSDFMQEVPLAAGIEFNRGALTAGFRTTYRILLDEAFADPAEAQGQAGGSLLDAAFTVGGRF